MCVLNYILQGEKEYEKVFLFYNIAFGINDI